MSEGLDKFSKEQEKVKVDAELTHRDLIDKCARFIYYVYKTARKQTDNAYLKLDSQYSIDLKLHGDNILGLYNKANLLFALTRLLDKYPDLLRDLDLKPPRKQKS